MTSNNVKLAAGTIVLAGLGAVAGSFASISLTKAHVPGDTLSVSYIRDGKSHTVDVKLGTRPA
jgi:S1-C subfamily serine protease